MVNLLTALLLLSFTQLGTYSSKEQPMGEDRKAAPLKSKGVLDFKMNTIDGNPTPFPPTKARF